MTEDKTEERVRGWLSGRLAADWTIGPPRVGVDREEVIVVLSIEEVALADDASEVELAEARAGRARAFREQSRDERMTVAREAEHRFERTISWGVRVGPHEELWTHVSAPVMTRLRQPQRQVLDTLVAAGVARSRADALGWCVRLVGQHEGDWLADLREAMTSVEDVRRRGPGAA